MTVVCCLHGDEVFGFKVFKYLQKHIKDFSGLKIILANQLALLSKKRYIMEDLNRVFPGQARGVHERVLAKRIMKEIGQTNYLLDIHTTTSDIKMTPIVTNFNKKTKRIINLCDSMEIVKMKKSFGSKALIGQFDNAVSLEFNNKYAEQQAVLLQAVKIIKSLLSKKQNGKKLRKIFFVDDVIAGDQVLSKSAKNFVRHKKLYPFLLGEKAYTDIQGFSAKRYIKQVV